MGPVGRILSPISALGYNRPGTPESRAEDKVRARNANTSIPGYVAQRPGTSTLTGGLDPNVGQKL